MNNNRNRFGSRLGFLVVAAGSTIGLSNFWRFPHLAIQYGGSAFILLYFCIAFFIGSLAITAEVLLGRLGRKNAVDIFGIHAPQGRAFFWKLFGGLGLIGTLLISFYYPIVASWVLQYAFLSPTLVSQPQTVIETTFTVIMNNFGTTFIAAAFIILLTNFIVARGLVNGTEKMGFYLLPMLLILLLILALRTLSLPGAYEGVIHYFHPDFSKLSGEAILAAMGQAFFSLSIGQGLMLTFGSYMKEKTCSVRNSFFVVFTDSFVAFIAGFVIMPAFFIFGINTDIEGPSLAFVSIPALFSHIGGGPLWATIFFLLLTLAGTTTIIATSEAVGAFLCERFNMSRKKAMTLLGTFQIICMGIILASQTKRLPLTIGKRNLFDAADYYSISYVIPFGALAACLYLGIYHRKTIIEKAQDFIEAPFHKFIVPIVSLISFLLPLFILTVFLRCSFLILKNMLDS